MTIKIIPKDRKYPFLDKPLGEQNIWVSHPVHLSEAQQRSLNMDLIKPILKVKNRSPSVWAKIPADQVISPLIKQLDEEYQRAITTYKTLLNEAEQKDNEEILAKRQCKIYERTFFATIQGWFGAQIITEETYNRDTQVNRYNWLQEVNIREKIRLDKLKNDLSVALRAHISSMNELTNRNLTKIDIAKTTEQLQKIFNIHFPKQKY